MLFNRIMFSLVLISSLFCLGVDGRNEQLFGHLEKSADFLFQDTDSTRVYLTKFLVGYKGDMQDSLYADYVMLLGEHQSIKGEVDLAMVQFKKSHGLFTDLNNFRGIARSLLSIGEVYYNWGQYDQAKQYFLDAEEISLKHDCKKELVRAMNYIGKYYHSKGNLQRSFEYYNKSLKLALELKDTVGIISLNNKMGKHYKTIGEYPKALECFLTSEELVRKANNKIEEASTYNHLGNIYHSFEDYSKAIYFHKLALATREKMGYKEGVAKSLKNLGEVYSDINELDSALVCFEQSCELCNDVGYAKGLIKNIHSQGIVYSKQKKYDLAIDKFSEALETCEQLGYGIGEIRALTELANTYKQMGDFERAVKYANVGLDISDKEDVKASMSDFYFILFGLYESTGKNGQALEYFKKYTQIKDEILNLESNQKIAELQNKYEMSLQNRENEVLLKENQIKALLIKRKNQLIVFAAVITSLLAIVLFFIYGMFLHKKKANEKLTELNDNVVAQNKELDRLNKKLKHSKDQQVKLFSIVSHELRNPLYWFRNLVQMLSSRIDVLDKDMITKSLDSINESANNTFHLMDNLLHWSRSQLGNIKFMPEPVDMDKLINDNVKLISQYAEYKSISIGYQKSDRCLVMADKAMVQTVVRNLLSNAMKFTPRKGKIDISCECNDSSLSIQIEDSGVGMNRKTIESIVNSNGTSYLPTTDQETGSGIGLALSKEFVEKNGGTLGVTSEEGKGSKFTFELPLCLS